MGDLMFTPGQAKKARDLAARDAAIGALSEAAKQERDRRALAKQFYERQRLWSIGICPDCFNPFEHCECEQTADDIAALNQDDDAGDFDVE